MTDAITRINELRQKVLHEETLTKEEALEALKLLRQQREKVAEVAAAKEAKKPPVNLNDLFT